MALNGGCGCSPQAAEKGIVRPWWTTLVTAIRSYEEVAQGGGDTQAATMQLLDALDAVDWC